MNTINPFAPHLTGQLTEETQALVAEQIVKEHKSLQCKDEDIIRRVTRSGIFCVRLSCEMSEKIMHTPAYNRLNGKKHRST